MTLTIGNVGVAQGVNEVPGPVTAIGSFAPAAISGFQHGDTIVVNTAEAASFVVNGSAIKPDGRCQRDVRNAEFLDSGGGAADDRTPEIGRAHV